MKFKLKNYLSTVFLIGLLATSNLLLANEVVIEKAVFRSNGVSWSVDVTLKHADTGWKHYADAWRIIDSIGNEIAKRTLYHPHVSEQPFTRSLSIVKIPENLKTVYIEAHDTVHKWSATKLKIDLVNNKRSDVSIIR
jgi:hypothetical protein